MPRTHGQSWSSWFPSQLLENFVCHTLKYLVHSPSQLMLGELQPLPLGAVPYSLSLHSQDRFHIKHLPTLPPLWPDMKAVEVAQCSAGGLQLPLDREVVLDLVSMSRSGSNYECVVCQLPSPEPRIKCSCAEDN